MIGGFHSGVDIHTVTASQVFSLPQDQVPPELRRAAKAVNFGIVYGISAYSLSEDIHVSVPQAKEYMEKYFQHYSGVRAYMDRVVEQGREDGFVSTLYGRRRWLPELKSSNFNTRSFGERVALNMPIQGTAADIIKLAMIRVDARLRAEGPDGEAGPPGPRRADRGVPGGGDGAGEGPAPGGDGGGGVAGGATESGRQRGKHVGAMPLKRSAYYELIRYF